MVRRLRTAAQTFSECQEHRRANPSSHHRIVQELHGILVADVNCTVSRASTRMVKCRGQRRGPRVKNQVRIAKSRERPSQSRSFAHFPPSITTVAKANAPAGEGMEGLAAA